MESFWQDARFAARVLRKSPGYTITAILTLMLGIGATTAIFTVVDRILLKPFAGPDSGRIVVLMNTFGNQKGYSISIPKFMMWRDQMPMLEDASLYGFPGGLRVNLLGGDQPQQYRATQVSANTFSLYGIPFDKGRGFTAQEDTAGGPPAAVISNGMWRAQFGSDPNIVGKAIDLDGIDRTVVGVMAYSVQQRTQEIGIRMTLGASPENVQRMVVRQGMVLAGIGVVIGVAGGLAITRVMRSLLFGVKPWDPLMFALTAIVLAIVALVACYVPARRASRVNPLIALRYE